MTAVWERVVPRSTIPVIVVCHNLVTDLCRLVEWLEESGHGRIILLDNASTYPPLLQYLDSSPHDVIRLEENLGQQAPWLCGLVDEFGDDEPFVVTDPDVVPDEDCPHDAVEYFQELLLKYDEFDQAGFGLRIDDIPPLYPHRDEVVIWEKPFWEKVITDGVYAAHIDTTFAVYRPRTPYKVTEALRTGSPYIARHLSWYRDPTAPDAEMAYFFRNRREDVGYWNRNELPDAVARHLAESGRA